LKFFRYCISLLKNPSKGWGCVGQGRLLLLVTGGLAVLGGGGAEVDNGDPDAEDATLVLGVVNSGKGLLLLVVALELDESEAYQKVKKSM